MAKQQVRRFLNKLWGEGSLHSSALDEHLADYPTGSGRNFVKTASGKLYAWTDMTDYHFVSNTGRALDINLNNDIPNFVGTPLVIPSFGAPSAGWDSTRCSGAYLSGKTIKTYINGGSSTQYIKVGFYLIGRWK